MKKIKMILPALAIVFAVAAALVTNASPKTLTIIDLTSDPGVCDTELRCDIDEAGICETQAVPLYVVNQACVDFVGQGKKIVP